jgi:multidrug efflux pump subunit AcrA (membrane-fusion protein)
MMFDVKKIFKSWKFRILLVVAVLIVVLYVASRPNAEPATVIQPRRHTIRSEVSDYGTTYFTELATIHSPASGWIEKIHVSVGDAVEAERTVLASISSAAAPLLDPRTRATLSAQMETARAVSDQAEIQLRRIRTAHTAAEGELKRTLQAYAAGAVTLQELENLRSRVRDLQGEIQSARAAADAARHQRDAAAAALSKSVSARQELQILKAPRSGIVSWIHDDKVRFASIGTPLMDVAIPDKLAFQMDVLAREGMSIRTGSVVRFSDFPSTGVVRAISPTALAKVSPLGLSEQRTRVWIEFSGALPETVPAGLELEAHIEVAAKEAALIVPRTAVWHEGNSAFVYQVTKLRLNKKAVKTGIQSTREVEILAGLEDNDWIVELPTEGMQHGQKISPQPEPQAISR